MEILIAGIVLVVLMAFVSTKIKKSAARAFEREIVETEEFKIVKPEGFINPVNDDSEFAFEAYSRDSGKNEADVFHQAEAKLTAIFDSDFETIRANAKKSGGKILSEKLSENAAQNQKICLIESETSENGVGFVVFRKIVESIRKRKIYELRILVLENYRADFASRTNEMLESFTVK